MADNQYYLNTDVLIVGAGPTGLMAANQLNRFGVEFIIIDAKSGPTEQSRAIAVTSRSLEIYQQMGLSDEILEHGQRINSFNFYSKGKKRGEVVIDEIGNGHSDFTFLLGFEQSKNEEILYRNLLSHGKEVHWETTFLELSEKNDQIEVAAQKNGEKFPIRTKYLIACDGASSPVRHQLKMKFKGGTYENKFFVVDTVLRWQLKYDGLVISPGDQNFVGFFPMKGKSNYRVLGTLPRAYHNKTDITFPEIEKVIIDTIGVDVIFEKVNWFSIYNLHHRRVDQFRHGRIFLAGDAAHIHSPAGGQGMNTGLQDAYNLAWKLAFVLKGYAKLNLLDTYNEERLPFAKWLMSFTDRGFNLMTNDHWLIAFVRRHFAVFMTGFILKSRWIKPFAFISVSQIGYSYHGKSLSGSTTKQKLKFKTGDRLPYVLDENTSRSIYHFFIKPSFHLLHIGNNNVENTLLLKLNENFAFPLFIVENGIAPEWKKLGVNNDLYIIVRPDNYILYISDTFDLSAIRKHLQSYFIVD